MTTTNLFPQLLTALFKALRKQGVVARQRAACCRTCASYQIATEEGGILHGKLVVYTTAQDYPLDATEGVYLKYGAINNSERGKTDPIDEAREEQMAQQVAGMVVETAKAIGLEVEWDGDTNYSVLVRAKQPEAEPTFLDLYKQEA